MGGWRLEIAKMALYITFPVALFHYFNQPKLFEEWVIQTKREMYPPEDPMATRQFQNALKKVRDQQEMAHLKALENNTQS